MSSANFSLEFDLNISEIRKLNKMYFKGICKKRVLFFLVAFLLAAIFFDFFNLNSDNDIIEWIIGNLFIVIAFLLFQYLFVNAISKVIFQLVNKLMQSEHFIRKYKFNFTNSFICVHSPLGEFVHKWCYIEKAILTKDFLFLYFKERNGYIISISNQYNGSRKMEELIAFVEKNVMHITKI